jgi:hypothetical protein
VNEHPILHTDPFSGRPIITLSQGARPPMPPVGRRSAIIDLTHNTFTEDNDMTQFINREAADLAADILSERKTDGLRDKVKVAVDELAEYFADVGDGSVFSFARTIDERTFHFAAIKSGGLWYSTGSARALSGGDDDALITWLVSLEIYDQDDLLASALVAPAQAIIEIEPVPNTKQKETP